MAQLTLEEKQDNIKEVICDTRRQFERAGHKVHKIARELALIGYSDIADYVTVDEGGALQVLPLDTLKKHKSRAIKKIREKTIITESKSGDELYKTSTVEFELYDKLSALNLVVEIIGIKKPLKIEHSGTVNLADRLKKAREYAKTGSKTD
jgi:hypothetical protein